MPDEKIPGYKVKVNAFEFVFTEEDIAAADLIQKSPSQFHLLHDHHSVNAVLLESTDNGKHQVIEVDGESFDVQISDELDQMLDKLGFTAVSTRHIKEIKAPMPGLVLEVNVTEGQAVQEGDKLLILVAMKMENSIVIHADATIKKICVKAGDPVDKGQILVELE